MSLYVVSVDAIALAAATAKSVLEIATPSTDGALIKRWWIEFDGVTAAAVPVKAEVGRFSAGVTTATSITPWKKRNTAEGASALTVKHSTSTEGAGTASDVEIHRIPPTSGLLMFEPFGEEFFLAPSTFWRIRLTAAAIVNATIGAEWED